jgi:hypothetical protein
MFSKYSFNRRIKVIASNTMPFFRRTDDSYNRIHRASLINYLGILDIHRSPKVTSLVARARNICMIRGRHDAHRTRIVRVAFA